MADEPDFDLADRFAEIARTLVSEQGKQATLDKICKLAVETIEGCDHAGVTLVQGSSIESVAASHDVPRAVDRLQEEVQEGPCVDAIREKDVFVTGCLAEESRWPKFSRRAFEESQVQSVVAVRLFSESDTLGAINLYSRQRDAFSEEDVHVASLFAAHAAVAVAGMRQEEQFREAIQNRDVIGRAKGILMARSGVSDDEAFQILRSASQRMNVKLREIARRIAEGSPEAAEASNENSS